jgi:hypothetical protein
VRPINSIPISPEDLQVYEQLLQQGQSSSSAQATGPTIEIPAATMPRSSAVPPRQANAPKPTRQPATPAAAAAKPNQQPAQQTPSPAPAATKTPSPRATGEESYWSLLLTGMGWACPSFIIVQGLKSGCKFWATNPLALQKTSVGWYLGNLVAWFLMTPLVWVTIAFAIGVFIVWTDNSSRTTITRQRFQILLPILGYLLALVI